MYRKGPGRPLKFETPEIMQKRIDAYFESCWKKVGKGKNARKVIVEHYTITGLACALDTDRITLLHYEDKPEFVNTIKAAKSKIERYHEQLLLDKTTPAGVIFSLKNNYGWVDKRELGITGDMSVDVVIPGVTVKVVNEE